MAGRADIKPLSLEWYASDTNKDDYVLFVRPIWPTIDSEKTSEKNLKEFIEDQLKIDIRKGFIRTTVTSKNRALVIFDSNKWMNENFLRDPKVKFIIPRTLEWSFKKSLPDTLLSHTDWMSLKKFLERKFKEFLKGHQKTIFREKMQILSKIDYNWFDYEADLQWNKFYVKMKPSVMMAFAVGLTATASAFHSKRDTDSWRNR